MINHRHQLVLQAISETKSIIAELENALKLLKEELGHNTKPPTPFVSAQISPDINMQGMRPPAHLDSTALSFVNCR